MTLKKNPIVYILIMLTLYVIPVSAGNLNVHFLDVGQGLCIYAECDGETLIYDGGGRSSSDFVISYLKQQGVERIDHLICSHYDEDHMAGLIGCLHVFDIGQVTGPDYERDTELYQSFINNVAEKGLSVMPPSIGESTSLGSSEVIFIGPVRESGEDNDNSVCIKLVKDEVSYLFTGDASITEEHEILDASLPVKSSVLCLGHHGSSTSSGREFLEYVSPDAVVISCGYGNSYGHPHAETMLNVEEIGASVYRTDLQGTLMAVTDGIDISWSAEPSVDLRDGYSLQNDIKQEQTEMTADTIHNDWDCDYVLNCKKKTIHCPDCDSVTQMKPENREYYHGTYADIPPGYHPCGSCKPDENQTSGDIDYGCNMNSNQELLNIQ